eukprot:GHVU01226847.1.p1 GENE.GHVU01226847.1~~GHVU01226847.1.p1  ORF type:complete len:330 (-),score=48.08 GHVU01226847.1:634-1623(-)
MLKIPNSIMECQFISSFYHFFLSTLAGVAGLLKHSLPCVYKFLDFILLAQVDLVSLACARFSAKGLDKCRRPKETLVLYEAEGCSQSRKVREMLNVLDLDYLSYPVPKDSMGRATYANARYGAALVKDVGILSVPCLVDPNDDRKSLLDAESICEHLLATYGAEAASLPANYRLVRWSRLLSFLRGIVITMLRPGAEMGKLRVASKQPEKPLEVWANESSPYSRKVREALTMLEVPHLMHTMPMGSEKRKDFAQMHKKSISSWRQNLGLVKIPFIVDPNTGAEMFESAQIVEYLKKTYQTGPDPSETSFSCCSSLFALFPSCCCCSKKE